MKIWIHAKRSWIMGGNVDGPICCDVEPSGQPQDVGKGFKMMTILSPKGDFYYVDPVSGGLLGRDLAMIKQDVAEGDPIIITTQLLDMKKIGDKASVVEPAIFWNYLK